MSFDKAQGDAAGAMVACASPVAARPWGKGDVLTGGSFEIPDNAGAALTATRGEVMA